MKPILVIFATREGQACRVAEHVAETLRSQGRTVEVADVATLPEGFSLANYSAAMVTASVHLGRHEAEMLRFVKRHRAELERMPSAFLSVCLAQAGAENEALPPDKREESRRSAQRQIDAFLDACGWHPSLARPVAGALMYRKYNFAVRFMMKHIAHRSGGSTDTSNNHEFTNWTSLDEMASELLRSSAVRELA